MFGSPNGEIIFRLILLAVLIRALLACHLWGWLAVAYTLATNVIPLVVYGWRSLITGHSLLHDALRLGACLLYFKLLDSRDDADSLFWLILVSGATLVLL